MLRFLLFLLLPALLPAQERIRLTHSCAYDGEENTTDYYTFAPSTEADRIVQEICDAKGLAKNFIVKSANVRNAVATMDGGVRLILYSTLFLEKFKKDTRTKWAAYSVLAHEIGHHLNGHRFDESDPNKRKSWELEADKFSGSALRMLGVPLEEAKAGIEQFALEGETQTHPSGSARREAVASGWKKQDEHLHKIGTEPAPTMRPTNPDAALDDSAADLAAWKKAKQANTEAAYREYLSRFPQGEFTELAEKALSDFETAAADGRDNTAWEIAQEKNTPEAYQKYLREYPKGRFCQAAQKALKDLEIPDNLVLVRGGTFQMGCNEYDDEKPVHPVTVGDFYLGKYEVTMAEFKTFIDDTGYRTDADKSGTSYVYTNTWKEQTGVNWKYDTRGNLRPSNEYNHPVIHVSWNDAVEYCKWLSRKTGHTYRLPTEAEWEYAAGAGAGNRTKWAGTSDENNLKRYANLGGNPDGHERTAPAGSLLPNTLRLYDMSGNVWEWCADDWHSNYSGAPTNGRAWVDSPRCDDRVLRGGSWSDDARDCRVADRLNGSPTFCYYYLGFRLCRSF